MPKKKLTDADLPSGALKAWKLGVRFVNLCPKIGETIKLSPYGEELIVDSRDVLARTFRTHDGRSHDVETPYEHVRYWGEQDA